MTARLQRPLSCIFLWASTKIAEESKCQPCREIYMCERIRISRNVIYCLLYCALCSLKVKSIVTLELQFLIVPRVKYIIKINGSNPSTFSYMSIHASIC